MLNKPPELDRPAPPPRVRPPAPLLEELDCFELLEELEEPLELVRPTLPPVLSSSGFNIQIGVGFSLLGLGLLRGGAEMGICVGVVKGIGITLGLGLGES